MYPPGITPTGAHRHKPCAAAAIHTAAHTLLGLVSLTIREGCTRSTTPPYVYTIQENNLQKGASCWALLEAPGRPWDEPCYGRPSPGQTATDPHSGHSGGCASATGGGHPPGGGASLPISPVQQRAFSHRWLWWPHSHTTTRATASPLLLWSTTPEPGWGSPHSVSHSVTAMILLQVHLQQPCYDFCFL